MIDSRDRRAIVHLLDLLCEHEESVVECATLPDGSLGALRDALNANDYRVVQRSRRIWRRAQDLIAKLSSLAEPSPRLIFASELGDIDRWDPSLRETLAKYEQLYSVKFVVFSRELAEQLQP